MIIMKDFFENLKILFHCLEFFKTSAWSCTRKYVHQSNLAYSQTPGYPLTEARVVGRWINTWTAKGFHSAFSKLDAADPGR